MAVVVKEIDCQQLEGSEFRVRKVEQTTVTVRFTGIPVEIPDDCFLLSNHYIECTSRVLKGKKLQKFWYHRWMWPLGICAFGDVKTFSILRYQVVYCVVAFFIWESLCVAMGMFIIGFLAFLLSCQYITVCCTSLCLVEKQPIVEGHSRLNDFVDINVSHVSAKYAIALDAGYGCLCTKSGTIKLQVFNPKALEDINSAREHSVGLFFLSIAMMGWTGLCIYSNASVLT